MQGPMFKPQIWVLFKIGQGQAFGQILAGVNTGSPKGWMYFISNPNGSTYSIWESDILSELRNRQ